MKVAVSIAIIIPSLCTAYRLTIPLIGPIPQTPPLMIGAELSLSPPTPLQWRALSESAVIHTKQLKKETDTPSIDGAPIIALIDEHSVKTWGGKKGRYATLAAVVGVSSGDEDLLELLRNPQSSRVRLVGIGRAIVKDLFYQVPSQIIKIENNDNYNDDDDDDGYSDEVDKFPIVMANFETLQDEIGLSANASPVHQINDIHKILQKVERVHNKRKRLVMGAKAAEVRLKNARKMIEVLASAEIDYDGLGLLFEGSEENAKNLIIEEFLDEAEDVECTMEDIEAEDVECTSQIAEYLSQMQNYGVNYYSAFSSVSELTKETQRLLEPFYTKKYRDREEYDYEIASFVAWRCLVGYCSSGDIALALTCTSPKDRLEWAYNAMERHTEDLEKMANELNDQLTECGEECTDLW